MRNEFTVLSRAQQGLSLATTERPRFKTTQGVLKLWEKGDEVGIELKSNTLTVDPNGSPDNNERIPFTRLFVRERVGKSQNRKLIEGTYDEKGKERIHEYRDGISENDAQVKLLGPLLEVSKETQIDRFGRTAQERENDRNLANILRDDLENIFESFGNDKMAHIKHTSLVINHKGVDLSISLLKLSGEYIIEIWPQKDLFRDKNQVLGRRDIRQYVFGWEDQVDQRVKYRLFIDHIKKSGTVIPDAYRKRKRKRFENADIATEAEIMQLHYLLTGEVGSQINREIL